MNPIYPVPSKYEGIVDPREVRSISCPDGGCCLDIYPLKFGKSVLLVGENGHLEVSRKDFEGIKSIEL